MSVAAVDEYRTNDMAMVTYLKVEGFSPQLVTWEMNTCYWVFLKTASLVTAIERFEQGVGRVEPKSYSKQFMLTKREFYDTRPAPSGRNPRR